VLKKIFISSIFLALFVSVNAQKELFFPKMDSIPIDYRSSGTWLDSIDAKVAESPNLRPGGGFGSVFEQNLAENLFLSPAGFAYQMPKNKIIPKFSGLPYIGFQYAFGSALTQDLNLEYQHFFRPNTHLHFRYNRNTSNGLARNSAYKLNDVHLRFYHQKRLYATNLEAFYGAYELNQNGGITIDSQLNQLPLEFIPVEKDDAKSKVRQLDIRWDNYFRLAGDSIVGFGLKTKHQFELNGREFTETVSDVTAIDTMYIDTNGYTRDQYQTSRISNGAGFYFDSKPFKVDATINHSYWENQNLGVYRDTNEIFLHSNLWTALGRKILLHNEFYFNLIGATGEIKNYAKLQYQVLKNLSVTGKVNFENVYPEPYLRFHSANYFQWKIDELKMQQKLQFLGKVKYGDTNFVQADIVWTNINNGRYFIGSQWRQDTLALVSLGAIKLKGAYRIKQWSFYPSISVRFGSENFNYQPLFSTLNRFAFTTKLFKAKRLGMSVGFDVGYQTKYHFMTYDAVFDLYQPVQSGFMTENLMQLNAFLALSIDSFRFFVKAENLSSLWQDATIRIDENYPITPFIFRSGITWDFFN